MAINENLIEVNQNIYRALEELGPYAQINPRIEYYIKMLGMMHSAGEDLISELPDAMAELSNIPCSFSDLLDDVNLIVSKSEGVVGVGAIRKEHGFDFTKAVTYKDNNFTSALLKVYACYASDSPIECCVGESIQVDGKKFTSLACSDLVQGKDPRIRIYEKEAQKAETVLYLDKANLSVSDVCDIWFDPFIGKVDIKWCKPFNGSVLLEIL